MEILKGTVVGAGEKQMQVKSNDIIYVIPLEKMGGAKKEKNTQIFLGKNVDFVSEGIDSEGRNIGNRDIALQEMRKGFEPEIGQELDAKIITVFDRIILVECMGYENYIPAPDCTIYYTESLKDSAEFTEGTMIKVLVKSVTPSNKDQPFNLMVRKTQDLSLIQKGDEYVGTVKSMEKKTVFVGLEISKTIVFCRPVTWSNAIVVGDSVVVEVTDIKEKTDKDLVFGHIKRKIG